MREVNLKKKLHYIHIYIYFFLNLKYLKNFKTKNVYYTRDTKSNNRKLFE